MRGWQYGRTASLDLQYFDLRAECGDVIGPGSGGSRRFSVLRGEVA